MVSSTVAGMPPERRISSAEEWRGKYKLAERALCSIDGVEDALIVPGTRGRPVDSISVTVDPKMYPEERYKMLTRKIEAKLMSALKLVIDYRVVAPS